MIFPLYYYKPSVSNSDFVFQLHRLGAFGYLAIDVVGVESHSFAQIFRELEDDSDK